MIITFDALFVRMNADATLKTKLGTDANGDILVFDDWPEEDTDWGRTRHG